MNYRTEDYKYYEDGNTDGYGMPCKRLFLNNKEISFQYPIANIIEYKELLIVRHYVMAGSGDYRNVYAFNEEGEKVWQIQSSAKHESDETYNNSFCGIAIEDNVLSVATPLGAEFNVDPKDGSIEFYKYSRW